MNLLSVNNISLSFGTNRVLNGLSMDIKKGSFISLLGVNGSGKSTLLNIIAGLSKPDSGSIDWANETSQNNVSYVFQNYRESLFPWKSAWENIALPLKLKGVEKAERKKEVVALTKRFDVEIDLEKFPYQLSGGQQQMVAILRAIITKPELVLFDEPFTALDYAKRNFLQKKIIEIWQETKTTILFVSHDIDEAILLADELFVLSPKFIEFNVGLERPRNNDTIEFLEFRKQVVKSI